MSSMRKPLLIYDGDCAFCKYCVDYARSLTKDAIDYQPFQALPRGFQGISEAEFRSAIQLVEPTGAVSSGAAAAFNTLALGGHGRLWAACYKLWPLFATVAEACYRWVARHRNACYRLSKLNSIRVKQHKGHSIRVRSCSLHPPQLSRSDSP